MAAQTTFPFGDAGARQRRGGKKAAATTPPAAELPARRRAAKSATPATVANSSEFPSATKVETSRVLTGDSLAVARQLTAGSIDCIYIDPPFGTGKIRVGRGTAYQDVDGDPTSFVAWLSPWLQESHRVLAAHGSLFVHLDYRTVHYIKVELDRIFGGGNFINEIIWCYAVGGKGARCFGKKHDTILWYGRSDAWAFFPEQIRVARRGGSHMKVVRDEHGHLVQQKVDRKTGRIYNYPVDAGKIPEDWWTDIEVLNHSAHERVGWPSQKPERLLQRIIAAVTKPGDLVADWFAGSGTTAAVAQRLGRRYLVVDREATATALINRRLQPTLDASAKAPIRSRTKAPANVPAKPSSSSKKPRTTKTKRSR
ncbi:MAG: site-specific DNA-methyltransferase [Kofleriaceae bacterium]|nr:site-specific DNA-methyltransferase [Kofleriaceae bacterium]